MLQKGLFLCSIFFNIFALSCTKESQLISSAEGWRIRPLGQGIVELKDEPWRVGIKEKKVISKGLKMGLRFPHLSLDDVKFLYKEIGLDSWLVKVSQLNANGEKILAYYSIPVIFETSLKKGGLSVREKQTSFFNIYYAAASISNRARQSPCPVMNHNLKIDSIDLKSHITYGKDFTVFKDGGTPIPDKVEIFSYGLIVINGGKQLQGEYKIEVALYNSKIKKALSNFVSFDKKVIVKESPVQLLECQNFRLKDDNSKKGFEFFKFGR